MTKKLLLAGMFAFLIAFSGCANPFTDSAKKDTDEAIFEDIQKAVDGSDWDSAITKFNSLSTAYKSRRDIIEAWAGTYAGKCGLNLLTYASNLTNATLTGTTFFKFLMAGFTTTAVNPTYCDLAQAKMEEISALASGRTADENFFMGILGMAKMGTYLRSLADVDQDGATDVTFDSCMAGSLPDANLNNIITGMGLLADNVSYLIATGLTGSIATLTGLCGASCGKTDPATVTVGDRDAFRDILKTGSTNSTLPYGIESCANPLVTPCCP